MEPVVSGEVATRKLRSGRYDKIYRVYEGDRRGLYVLEDGRVPILIADIVWRTRASRQKPKLSEVRIRNNRQTFNLDVKCTINAWFVGSIIYLEKKG